MKAARSIHFEVQEKTEGDDGRGGTALSWATKFRITGKMKALKGYEMIRGQALTDKITHRVETWYDSRVSTAHRLTYSSRTFDIRFVENVNERNVKMLLHIEEVQS
jgi:SPP1 family predicted phage head-tail adaptor